MELGTKVLERVRRFEDFSRWEKAELGRELRRHGLSYGEIMKLIPVKKSTLATWCRDVTLTDEQIAAIRDRRAPLPGIPRDTQRKRRREIELISAQAMLEAEHLVDETLWVAGVSLYWGEGFKTQNQLGIAMADPSGLRMFMKWGDRYHRPQDGYRARLNLHADNNEPAARAFWACELGLDLADFNKSYIKPDGTGHRKNHLPHGVCSVTMRKSSDAFHATAAWIGFLQERYGR